MIGLGLSATAQAELESILVSTHSLKIGIEIQNLSGDTLADVSSRLIDGQVNIDSTADVTRTLTLSLTDPNRTLAFDSNSPANGALYVDRMIAITYSVKRPGKSPWIDVPLFVGPIVKLDRDAAVVNIEAQGKEALALGSAFKAKSYKENAVKVDVIRSILEDFAGEDKFSLPEAKMRLPRDLSLTPETKPWEAVQKVARGMGRQYFYDGRGVFVLRWPPAEPIFTFTTGQGGSVLTNPQISFSIEDMVNVVKVVGGKPKGKKTPITYTAVPADADPLHPKNLGRNGVWRRYLETLTEDTLTTRAEAKAAGEKRLNEGLAQAVDISFDAIPIPHLEPGDLAVLKTTEFSQQFPIRSLSIPLLAGGTMSVGVLKNVRLKKRGNR